MKYQKVFLDSSSIILHAITDLTIIKMVNKTFEATYLDLCIINRKKSEELNIQAINELLEINRFSFNYYKNHLDQSYVVFSYSWLDSYLSLVEELLYLNNPNTLGENITIKLGKILESQSISSLVHDISKKKVKEKSSWGLKNRLTELREQYNLEISISEDDIEYISNTRNIIVHDKRIGELIANKNSVSYAKLGKDKVKVDSNKYIFIIIELFLELFVECAKAFKVSEKNKVYLANKKVITDFQKIYKRKA